MPRVPHASPSPVRNHLRAGLTDARRVPLAPYLGPVTPHRHDLPERPGRAVGHVHFPDFGFASVAAVASRRERIAVAAIGCCGMTGLAVLKPWTGMGGRSGL